MFQYYKKNYDLLTDINATPSSFADFSACTIYKANCIDRGKKVPVSVLRERFLIMKPMAYPELV